MKTRFAPSPTGYLHVGGARTALFCYLQARAHDGIFLLRIEDIDRARSKAEFEQQIYEDLAWLGLSWPQPVLRQSDRLPAYRAALDQLIAQGLCYPCRCTRGDIRAALSAPQEGATHGPDGLIYPGTCKRIAPDPARPPAWRLDAAAALAQTGPLAWEDELAGAIPVDLGQLGDVVLLRKDLPASYHLAVTLDDAADGVTLVTRGADLFASTHVHRLLQALFDLPVPRWHHHPLLLDEDGEKLAKRRGSPSLAARREAGEDGLMLAQQLRLHIIGGGTSQG